MDNLRASIDFLFREISPDDILNKFWDIRQSNLTNKISKENFYSNLQAKLPYYNEDEIGNIYSLMDDILNLKKTPEIASYLENKSIFNLLLFFSSNALTEIDEEPVCKYENLLRWNDISHKLGEEIFTTSFFAFKDFKSNNTRDFFSWKPILSTNNIRIKNLLSQGTAENHFHLRGSAPYLSISWISLMNNIKNRNNDFKELTKLNRLKPELVFKFSENITELSHLVKKAAYIRAFMFIILNKELNNFIEKKNSVFNDSFLKEILTTTNTTGFQSLDFYMDEINREIVILKSEFGKVFESKVSKEKKVADYAIPHTINIKNFNGTVLLYGERHLLYSFFKGIFQNKNEKLIKYQDLFYAYLVIKSKFRQEMIQLNNQVGFKNFLNYQNRKDFFIQPKSIYDEAINYMAVSTSMKNQNIKSLEIRITPKDCKYKLSNSISFIDKCIESKTFLNPIQKNVMEKNIDEDKAFFYTLHFIKRKDNNLDSEVYPRHYQLRRDVKKESLAIINLRKSLSKSSSRILGIDAANIEIGCRPEIFAQAFRFLKEHNVNSNYKVFMEKTNALNLRSTFHAGEDFLDLVDGLRYIDEAIKFCNLSSGDRIGHALALGINPSEYYSFKNHILLIPKQDLLDNIVWLLAKIRKYNISGFTNLVYYLEKKYNELFCEIYINIDTDKKDFIPHSIYYDAWKLRGDDPKLYSSGKYKVRNNLTFWDRCGINISYPQKNHIREDEKASFLYYSYHFNPEIKKNGAKIEEFTIEDSYIEVVKKVQKKIQKELVTKLIGIECNPSSNYLISYFKKYSKHPIINFYNLGLTHDIEKINSCPQLFVSINTDDQGVFNTYLENEYALMALALEKEKNEKGESVYNQSMIYDWLDRIRRMGIEQSFNYKINNNNSF